MSIGAGPEPLRPTWATAFLDLAPGAERVLPFWCAVTGYSLSPWRGEHAEFATLLPADSADDHLCVQRLGRLDTGPWRVHLDLTVAAPGEDIGPAAVRRRWRWARGCRPAPRTTTWCCRLPVASCSAW